MSEVISHSPAFFGHAGVALALVLANVGAAYGTAKAGAGISGIGIWKPQIIMKSLIPVVMAGILGIYGMIVSVILIQKISKTKYTDADGYAHFAAGLSCGFSSLAAGYAIGIVGDACVRANALQEKIFVGMILILIFAEALGLYGLIIALILSQ
ncbi:vacuolar type h+-ATPase proteolipid subunit, putative [Ichthyophthirius multifiliis]|uniref:V-type proton ATPase proteolipid subunit n=1 Tax=Ichthyophthirius multifiliis TaxID=5932 RepID=G0QMI1_ICHMU|nr:vacuolar type h+-ATPase proteolipid subunit, putative [Ichthyophthirius multifiliis]EGR33577.1 vacuolar type h+-ATPase proteolipid subunit, putative [Ichthyophthirius multifiliis]|eukprot:XP_004037563.1 vacuolar type h+-ATPase proteolipid subunit, putative [Ichthyophthirius multifiliis]